MSTRSQLSSRPPSRTPPTRAADVSPSARPARWMFTVLGHPHATAAHKSATLCGLVKTCQLRKAGGGHRGGRCKEAEGTEVEGGRTDAHLFVVLERIHGVAGSQGQLPASYISCRSLWGFQQRLRAAARCYSWEWSTLSTCTAGELHSMGLQARKRRARFPVPGPPRPHPPARPCMMLTGMTQRPHQRTSQGVGHHASQQAGHSGVVQP